MSKLLMLLVVVVCVLGRSLGASFQELHKKILSGQRKNFKQVVTTANLGTVGFGAVKFFPNSACSGSVFSGLMIGTGTCFTDGTGSTANVVVGSTAGPIVTVNVNSYSDTACTTLINSDANTGSTTCLADGGVSEVAVFFTSFPSLSSTFGAGTFSG